MEKDDEAFGEGNSYTTEFRQYDPRLGRWKSLDPLMTKFPWMSPYVAFDNNPVYFVDPYGLASEDGGSDGGGDTDPPPGGDTGNGEEGSTEGSEETKKEPSVGGTGYKPEGLPDQPVDGSIYTAKNGKHYMYNENKDGVGEYTSFELSEGVTVKPKVESEIVVRNGVPQYRDWRKGFSKRHKPIQKYSDGHTIFHDDINNQTEKVQAQWRRSRANVKAVNNLVEGIMMNAAVTGLSLGTASGLSFGGRFIFGASSNTFNQLSYNKFDYKQIDVTNVFASGLTNGLVPSVYGGGWKGMVLPVFKVATINGIDATIDFTVKDKLMSTLNGRKSWGRARVDFGFGVGGAFIPSASPLIPYQIQMAPSSFMLYGINNGINQTFYPLRWICNPAVIVILRMILRK